MGTHVRSVLSRAVLSLALLPFALLVATPAAAGTGDCVESGSGFVCYGDYAFGDCSAPGGYERKGTGLYAELPHATVTAGGFESCHRAPHRDNWTYHERGLENMVYVHRSADDAVPVGAGAIVYQSHTWSRTEWNGRTWGPGCYQEQGAAVLFFGGTSSGPCRIPPPEADWGNLLP
ncbi:MAG TPA: hypothetical protein VNZ52_14890 [Candidatus Thermoplasmatota archaeon]|nr:hypothetical protein [Candidatus Thermoplasmatota archaeon]